MDNFRIFSFIQALIVLLGSVSFLEFHVSDVRLIWINNLLGLTTGSQFWNHYAFWAYLVFLVGILQLVKAFKANPNFG
ncbi:MAG: hypothetical protein ACW967_03245 [Candidatus Hodarchaeales archaeon]|jgi:hypothetical protein